MPHSAYVYLFIAVFLSLVPLMAAENKKKNYRRRKVKDDADASEQDEAEAVDVK